MEEAFKSACATALVDSQEYQAAGEFVESQLPRYRALGGSVKLLELHLNGVIAFNRIAEHVETLVYGNQNINLFIDCLGGEISAAFQIYDLLLARNTIGHIEGKCFSAASVIAMACKRLTISPTSSMMLHAPQATFTMGDSKHLRLVADQIDRLTDRHVEIFTKRTKQTREVVQDWFSKDTYFTPAEAVAAGLVDQIL